MKDVIDVMELQREKHRSRLQPMDYRKLEFAGGFTPARFIFECGIKLRGQPLTVATAAILMHRFFREVDPNNYDCYVSLRLLLKAFLESRSNVILLSGHW